MSVDSDQLYKKIDEISKFCASFDTRLARMEEQMSSRDKMLNRLEMDIAERHKTYSADIAELKFRTERDISAVRALSESTASDHKVLSGQLSTLRVISTIVGTALVGALVKILFFAA